MHAHPIDAARFEVGDPLEAIEAYLQRGWSDGLPVIPPTEERIREMLAAMGKSPGDVLGEIPARARRISAEKLAINAILAGCLPGYAPVLLAMVEALCDPAFAVHGPTSSTSGMGVLVVVNGPIAPLIGVNAGENLFGPGWRANATIGRALRLLLRNVCGSVPGVMDRSVFGHPGKYTYCIAENEADSPWTPLHVERGIPTGESAVTLFAGEAPHLAVNQTAADPEAVLATIADVMVGGGRLRIIGQQFVVVIGGEHRLLLHRHGWDKPAIRRRLWELAARSAAEYARVGRLPPPDSPEAGARLLHAAESPEDILLLAAGGDGGGYSAVIPGWAGRSQSAAVTTLIPPCPTCRIEG
jgi:hypothetical protein